MVYEISIYLLITLICGIALIVMALFGFGDLDFEGGADIDMDVGGDFDAGAGDIAGGLSPLSLPLLLSFGTSFGAFGMVFTSMGFSSLWTPLLAGLISIGISVIIFILLLKVFIQTQVTTQVDIHTLVGEDAVVTIPIRPGAQGQIRIVTEERGRTLITAISDEEIPTETVITIQNIVGSTAVVRRKTGLVN